MSTHHIPNVRIAAVMLVLYWLLKPNYSVLTAYMQGGLCLWSMLSSHPTMKKKWSHLDLSVPRNRMIFKKT